MPELDRRHFFRGALASGALLTAGPVGASGDPLRARAAAARKRWAEGKRDAEDLLFVDRLEEEYPDARADVAVLAHGLGAFAVVRDLIELEPEDQAHPEVQSALRDALQAIGEMSATGTAVVERYQSDHGETPDGESNLRLAVRAMRLGVKDWKATVGHQRLVDGTLHDLVADERPGRLRARVAKQLRRGRRTAELGRILSQDPSQTGLMSPSDPQLAQAAERGRQRWAHLYSSTAAQAPTGSTGSNSAESDGRYRPKPLTSEQWAAMVGLGLIAAGGLVLGGWAYCAVICGDLALLPLALLGFAIYGLALWGVLKLDPASETVAEFKAAKARLENRTEAELRSRGVNMVKAKLVRRVLFPLQLRAHHGPTTVVSAEPYPRRLALVGLGQLRLAGQGAVNANGRATSAGPSAVLPGAPSGCLLAHFGDGWRFVGTTEEITLPMNTELRVVLNFSTEERGRVHGRIFAIPYWYKLSGSKLDAATLPPDLTYAR
jgi:hypothetical protein